MRVVVTGATGNVGTSLLAALADEPRVTSVLGIARRVPRTAFPRTAFAAADVGRDAIAPLLAGADCVVHLAWVVQPSHDEGALWRTNVEGSTNVFQAAADAGVPALVHASSVGVYSPGQGPVDESWPRDGIPSSWYSRQKAEVERRLDRLEREHPQLRVVRLRPALTMKREAGEEVRRLFLGPLVPVRLLRPGRLPFVPALPGLKLQVVHSLDVGHAYRLAIVSDSARGAYNVATDPVLGPHDLATLLRSRTLPLPATAARAVAAAAWRLRLQPTSPDWIDLALQSPVLDWSRIRAELEWLPRYDAYATVAEMAMGLASRAHLPTPPLAEGSPR
jgi:UDP-glucose 4-epimerase